MEALKAREAEIAESLRLMIEREEKAQQIQVNIKSQRMNESTDNSSGGGNTIETNCLRASKDSNRGG